MSVSLMRTYRPRPALRHGQAGSRVRTLLKGHNTQLDDSLELLVLTLDPRHGEVDFVLRWSDGAHPPSDRVLTTDRHNGHYVSTASGGCVLIQPSAADGIFTVNDRYRVQVLQVSQWSVRILIDELGD